ncbi:hypothetical protein H0X09_03555 [Candidatus Saccharibacteria bacterium]|nr:hypothetical protein [Candidatus Saccharibacteria bacterium]
MEKRQKNEQSLLTGNRRVGFTDLAEAFQQYPEKIREILQLSHTLDFYPYRSGLFPASALPGELGEITSMGMAWLRDSAHIADGLWQSGDTESATAAGRAILDIFKDQNTIHKMEGIINGSLDPKDPNSRPPVRVDGDTLIYTGYNDANIQNDSVGYSIWLASRLIKNGEINTSADDINTLALITRYLGAIRYWEDADSGHWEETRKVNASSIGVVVAGLKSTKELFVSLGYNHNSLELTDLINKGAETLNQILPYESPGPGELERRYDSALLFLVEPMNVVSPEQARMIVDDITRHMVRDIGIARYPKDSYWHPDFRDEVKLGERATFIPGAFEKRETLAQENNEAQWTLFDPLLSVYWGKQFKETGNTSARERQMWHLNRSLGQLVCGGPDGQSLLLPEAYFLERGQWVANDHVPLLWSQANLMLALDMFEKTSRQA